MFLLIKLIISFSKVNIGNKKYSNANIQDLILNGASIPRELASFTSSQTSKLFNQIDSSRSGSPSGEYSHSPISNGSNGYNSPQHFPQPPPPMTILPHSSHLSHQSLAGHLTSPTPNSAAAAAAAAAAAFFGGNTSSLAAFLHSNSYGAGSLVPSVPPLPPPPSSSSMTGSTGQMATGSSVPLSSHHHHHHHHHELILQQMQRAAVVAAATASHVAAAAASHRRRKARTVFSDQQLHGLEKR